MGSRSAPVAIVLVIIDSMDSAKAYTILGLKFGSSLPKVKDAYHKLVKLSHPDKNKNPQANSQFIQHKEAYDFLKKNISVPETNSTFGKYSFTIIDLHTFILLFF